MPLEAGTQLGPYEILSPLGAGGMGEVYKARDTRLDRTVAIKVLPEHVASDPDLKQRFEREARTVAALNHPHICTLYDIGSQDGVDFLVMEHLEGETLMDRAARGPMPVTEAIPLALTLVATLEVLHQQNVVHRDLKPANLFLTAHGLKLLDFGLARAVQRELGETNLALTSPGALVGTPQYMAPEALQGQAVDLRADLFAVGAVLYEMLAGRPAFIGGSLIDVAHAVIHTAPPVLTGSPAVVAVDRVINHALAKRPEERHQTAGLLADDLRRVLSVPGGDTARPLTRLMVLPFRVLRADPDTEFLAVSLPDAITTSLSGLQSLVVRSSLAAGHDVGTHPDLKVLAQQADVDMVLVGTIVRAADQFRVRTQLLEVPSGTVLWSHNAEVGMRNLFQLEDDLTRRLVESLSLPLTARDDQLLRRDVPQSATAYEFYLRANQLGNRQAEWSVAKDLYERSVEQDPSYALAWARLGRIYRVRAKFGYGDRKEGYARAEAAFQRALALNRDLPEAHQLYTALELDQGRPTEAMVRLINQVKHGGANPSLFAGLVQACRYVGLLDASLAAHARARRLEPRIETSVQNSLWMAGEYQQAIDAGAGKPFSENATALSLIGLGRQTEARAVLDSALESPDYQGGHPFLRQSFQALRAVAGGDRDAALATLKQIDLEQAEADPEFLYCLGVWFVPAGDAERALSLIEKAVRMGFFCYPWMMRDSLLDPLRMTAEFQDLLAKVKAQHQDALAAFTQAGGYDVLGLSPSTSSSSS